MDNSGRVPLSQLPFHKGDLLSPANRLSISGLIDNFYFDVTNLCINKTSLKSSKVAVGRTFGLNNSIAGTYTSDANAVSNKIVVGNSTYVNGVKIDGTLSLDSVFSSAGGAASCGATSSIQPGTFYSIIGSNSVTGTNYCSKIDFSSDGSITATNKATAGICKQISSCDASLQSASNYPDGTVCGSNKVCKSGSCVPTPKCPYLYVSAANYAAANLPETPVGSGEVFYTSPDNEFVYYPFNNPLRIKGTCNADGSWSNVKWQGKGWSSTKWCSSTCHSWGCIEAAGCAHH